jgi:hypothetical protein
MKSGIKITRGWIVNLQRRGWTCPQFHDPPPTCISIKNVREQGIGMGGKID